VLFSEGDCAYTALKIPAFCVNNNNNNMAAIRTRKKTVIAIHFLVRAFISYDLIINAHAKYLNH
jgi:hypothetical protein